MRNTVRIEWLPEPVPPSAAPPPPPPSSGGQHCAPRLSATTNEKTSEVIPRARWRVCMEVHTKQSAGQRGATASFGALPPFARRGGGLALPSRRARGVRRREGEAAWGAKASPVEKVNGQNGVVAAACADHS